MRVLTRTEIRRGLRISTWEGVAGNIHNVLIGNVFLKGFALALSFLNRSTKLNMISKFLAILSLGLLGGSLAAATDDYTRLTPRPETGRYDLEQDAHHLRNLGAFLAYTVGDAARSLDLIAGATVQTVAQPIDGQPGRATTFTTHNADIEAILTLSQKQGDRFVRLQARIALLEPRADVRLQTVTLLQTRLADTFLGAVPREKTRFLRTGLDVWIAAGSIPLAGPKDNIEIDRAYSYHSTAVFDPATRQALTFQYRLPNRWLDAVIESEGVLRAENTVNTLLTYKHPLQSDQLLASAGLDYSGALAAMHTVHRSRRAPAEAKDHFGWNSWEAYGKKVTAADILANVDAINALPWLKARIRNITIDDGWQCGGHDWFRANDKFPGGMADLATKIKAAGFTPGIWVAPFLVDRDSPLRAEHPDWFIKKDGQPYLKNKTLYLDPTHPEARDYVYRIMRHLYDQGYRFFKTDFLREPQLITTPGRKEYEPTATCYDPNLGLSRGMRATMELIRGAIGENSFWNACGTDIGSCASLCDSARIGGDIGSYWTRVPNQARSIINHLHQHGALYLVDPDFLLLRSDETYLPGNLKLPVVSDKAFKLDAWQGGHIFTAADARTWASVVILSGGILNLTDPIAALNDTGLALIKTALEHAGGNAAVPIDIGSPIPGVLLRQDRDRVYLGLLNWSNDATVTLTATSADGVPFPKNGKVRDVWTGAEIQIDNGRLSRELAPHQSLLLTWTNNATTNPAPTSFQ